MKKYVILALVLMAVLSVTGCAAKTTVEESGYESSAINDAETGESSAINVSDIEGESNSEESNPESDMESSVESEETSRAEEKTKAEEDVITTENPYFFFKGSRIAYSIGEVDFDDEAPDTMELQIDLIQEFEEGAVYHLHFEGYELVDPRLRNRTDIGYFYVTPEKIYYRVQPGDVEQGVESIVENATLLVQEENREDMLEEEEEGWHDSIVVDGSRVTYEGYVYTTPFATNFYETYVWEEGKGLVEYVSGYGPGTHEVVYTQTEE